MTFKVHLPRLTIICKMILGLGLSATLANTALADLPEANLDVEFTLIHPNAVGIYGVSVISDQEVSPDELTYPGVCRALSQEGTYKCSFKTNNAYNKVIINATEVSTSGNKSVLYGPYDLTQKEIVIAD